MARESSDLDLELTSAAGARLVTTRLPAAPEGVVVVLHGGAARASRPMVSPTQLSVLRMIPVARHIARSGDDRLAVLRVLNSKRGWDVHHTPVEDAGWAIDQVRSRLGDLPVALVGHSLGGRAALLAGSEPGVRAVVALNPWVYPTDDANLSGRRVLIVHGTRDRIALPDRAASVAHQLSRRAEVTYVEVAGARHGMLRHGRQFEDLAAEHVRSTLLG